MKIPTLLEFFSLFEAEPDPLDPHGTRPKHAMSGGMGLKPKQQGLAPRSTPSFRPPEKRVDPATEFLRQHDALGGLKGPGSGIAPKTASTAGRKSKGGEGPLPDEMKPKYKGTFPGQTVQLGGNYVNKPVAFGGDDPEEKRYGIVKSFSPHKVTWNGTDWIRADDWGKKQP